MRLRHVSAIVAAVVLVTGCATEQVTDGAGSAEPTAPPVDGGPPSVGARDLTVLHPFTIGEAREGLRAMLAAFEALHPDVRVLEEGVGDPASRARELVAAGTPPDVIVGARPGLLGPLVADGIVRPLDAVIDRGRLESEVVPGVLDPLSLDGSLYAIPVRLSPKSLVWYSPATFAARGYAIPETWDELIALSDTMVVDGLTPWCIGIESAGATGWVVTDWIEDILLRSIGAEDYERWVAGTLAFSSPSVQGAIEQYLVPIWTNDAYVLGGRERIAREPFTSSVAGILGGEPDCGLHRQGMVAEQLLADRVPGPRFGVDHDFFLLPPIDPSDRPVLGDVDAAALVTDGDAARRFLTFLATPGSGEAWARRGGFVSPFVPVFDRSLHPAGPSARAAELLTRATAFHLDGSDRMPAEIGASARAGSFWSEITAWVKEERELGEALANIDALATRLR